MGPIGYYVHHHGDGHRHRALHIAGQAPERFVLIGTGLAGRTGNIRCLDLPDDRLDPSSVFDGVDQTSARPSALHYAPLHHSGIRKRVAAIAAWIETERPPLMVVDVSVEIAMLARLAATPAVYVRLCGARSDAPHLDAFRSATHLLAPYHADLDDPDTPSWIARKTAYFCGFATAVPVRPRAQNTLLVVKGTGGSPADGEALAAAARTMPQWQWRVAGPASPPANAPDNLALLGWVDDVTHELSGATVVVGAAGDGLVAQLAANPRPFICLPEARPFAEQTKKAARLRALGAAVVVDAWPDPSQWPTLIAAAQQLGTHGLAPLHDPAGPARAAEFLLKTAFARPARNQSMPESVS
ncbi:MAG: glycosyltransferase [Hyphomicrobiaceae bacterium]|nr:glycosyltransferase [Hyphomicrobiaceae bacterium]